MDHWHIRLFVYDYVLIGPWWNLDQPPRAFWRFYCNTQDGAYVEGSDGPIPLEANRMYFIPSRVFFRSRCPAVVEHLFVHFDVIGMPGIAQRELFQHPIALPDIPHLQEAVQTFRRTGGPDAAQKAALLRDCPPGTDLPPAWPWGPATAGEDELIRECRIKAILYEAMSRHLAEIPAEQRARCLRLAATLEPVQPAIQYIAAHLEDHLAVGQLADLCCLSEDYFIRRFRECLGQTPTQYIQEQRVTHAAQRLLFSPLSIDQIAAESGFGNRHYFSRIFKRYAGVSPAAYRKLAPVPTVTAAAAHHPGE